MVAIISSPPEATCVKCLVNLEDECLKCSKCTANLHFRCSQLPDYMLLKFKTSQANYVCRTCVLSEGDPSSLDEQKLSIDNIIKKEIEAIKKAAYDDSIDALMNTELGNEDTKVDSNGMPTEKQERKCKFYLRGNCKHGKKGAKCAYQHPALCIKFTTKGDLKGGCKKGADCKYYHPNLCWSFKSGKVCYKSKCNFYHVKGTVRKEKDEEQFQQRKNMNHENASNYGSKRPSRFVSSASTNTVNEKPQNDGFVKHLDFLELKEQMGILQEQMRILIGQRMQLIPQHQMAWGQLAPRQ